MSFKLLIIRSLWHFRRLNLTVVAGVALSTAILLGALIIGDSVRYSLNQVTVNRLGHTSAVITGGERLFRAELAGRVAEIAGTRTAPLLRSNGMAILEGGRYQYNQVAVWGVTPSMENFPLDSASFLLNGNEAAINENLAGLAGLKEGDEFLLRVNKLSAFPFNTPFVSAEETTVSFRVRVKKILTAGQLGNFSLQNEQASPRNIFLSLDWLNRQMDLAGKANVILVAGDKNEDELADALKQGWNLQDLSLTVRENPELNYTEILSDRVFIEPVIEETGLENIEHSYPVFSYFVNGFTSAGGASPYSFVSSCDTLKDRQMLVSSWLAEDMHLHPGDSVRVTYFEVGPLRRLLQKDTLFTVSGIYPMSGRMADPALAPVIPGLSDAANCRDWKTGVPVDLGKIRPHDEAYWKQYRGAPKALISLKSAQQLWGNRFGQATAIRVDGLRGNELENTLLKALHPWDAGINIIGARSEGLFAASHGVDFGQLFIGLSFFALAAAFLLAWLLFSLFLGYRRQEVETLRAVGYPSGTVRKILFVEATLLTLTGILMGIPLAILYDRMILKAINSIWYDIVRTSIARVHLDPVTLWGGSLAMVLLFAGIFFYGITRFTISRKNTREIYGRKEGKLHGTFSLYGGILLILLSMSVPVFFGYNKGEVNPDFFYASGFGMLPGLLMVVSHILKKLSAQAIRGNFSYRELLVKRLAGNRKRTMLSVSFLAVGLFMVVATGLYRRDLVVKEEDPSSGTGGFNYYLETTVPLLSDPGTGQAGDGPVLPEGATALAFHVQPGDDASCLNLNRVARPRIMACRTEMLDKNGSFTFLNQTEESDLEHPWLSLNNKLVDNLIPAYADQSVIQWSLGKKTGDTLHYRNEEGEILKLKLIGGLANSVFQGNVIISEENFTTAFPSVSGANVFLVKRGRENIDLASFREEWRKYGTEITTTTERLQSFGKIENTYLDIFLMLGALGLLIGTAGLGILIFRTTLEEKPQFALLRSVGFEKSAITRLLLTEKILLVSASVLAGAIPATISALPVLLSHGPSGLKIWLPAVLLAVLASGIISGILASRIALKGNLVASLSGE